MQSSAASSPSSSASGSQSSNEREYRGKWRFDLTSSHSNNAPAPIGTWKFNEREEPTQQDKGKASTGKAGEVVKAAFTQGALMAFMMWMSGNSLHIFSIMFLVMFLSGPIRSLMALPTAFASLEEDMGARLLGYKLMYILANVFWLGVGGWKLSAMGLLPTTWSLFTEPPSVRFPVSGAFDR